MIKLEKVDKYYNKSKSNELHVINNISLELPETGFVTILGRSGSGKSTLLNIIGGLDKAKGKIHYDDLEISDYEMQKIDLYRAKYISYIFQNYLLIDSKSVYDNLKIALEFMGVYDHDEQNKRIEFVLKAVGLYKYRKKHADKLSGGQMQRVAIARALLKNNKVIIADEPTGNLDSENSLEVMNILKQISKKTLVLLVTHNQEIANFYSDRIIQMQDGGIIKDELNVGSDSLNHQSDHKIHLLDYEKIELANEKISLNLYSNEEKPLTINVIVKNNTVYIDSPHNVKIVDGVDIEIKNDHYQEIKRDVFDNLDFDISWYKENKNKQTKFFHYLKTALLGFFYSSRKDKIFHLIFVLIGVILAFCTISFVNYTTVEDELFSTQNDVYLITDNLDFYYASYNVNVIEQAIEKGYITEVYNYTDYYISTTYYVNSRRYASTNYNAYTYPYQLAGELIVGNQPQGKEVVIGSDLADYLLDEFDLNLEYQNLLGLKLNFGFEEFYICGITQNTNSIYFADDFYYGTYNYMFDYKEEFKEGLIVKKLDEFNFVVKEGHMPSGDNEVIANSQFYKINDIVNGMKVVGLYEAIDLNVFYANNVTRLKYYFSISGYEYNPTYSFKFSDLKTAEEYFAKAELEIITPYDLSYEYAMDMLKTSKMTTIIFIVILFAFSVIYIYFSIRSKMINQIKIIGVYRSIGATRWQISQVYLATTIVQTTLTAALGYILVCTIYSYIAINLKNLGGDILFNTKFAPLYLVIGLIVLYILHIFFGLLPVWSLMRKTPAEINAKYDI